MRRTTWLSLSFFLACGAIAGALAAGLVPAGLTELASRQLEKNQFRLTRPSDNLVEVTEGKWFLLPFLFGDFDLQMDVEVSEGTELDLLLRQVEPRLVDGHMTPFAGRFSVLRLSTEGDGEQWRRHCGGSSRDHLGRSAWPRTARQHRGQSAATVRCR